MRLRRFILASLAALVAFVSCEDLENLGLPTIKLDGDGTMAFEIAGGDQQITLTATRDWWIECDADWLDFLPKEGKASADAQTITITAKANGGMDRTADVKFSIGMSFQTLTVTQTGPGGSVQPGDGTKENPYSAEKANEVASGLGADEKITGVYVQGVVSEIKELSTDYGNATYWITDEGGKTTFYVYRGSYLGNAKFTSSDQLKVGDKVVVYGDLMNYMGDSPQLGQGNYIVNLNGTDGEMAAPESKGKKTVEEFIAAADESNYYELTGTVSGFSSKYCSFDLTDESGKIYVFSVLAPSKAEWSSKIANGGTITIYGKYLYYTEKSQHEVVDAWIVSYTPGEGGDEPEVPVEPGEYDPQGITWTLGANAYDNTSGQNAQYGKVNGVSVANLLKLGAGSKAGDATLHVPAGTEKIGFYAVAWKGKTAEVKFSINGTELTTIKPSANDGATQNPPYTITVTDDDYFVIEMPSADAADVKVETLDPNNGRVIFIKLEANPDKEAGDTPGEGGGDEPEPAPEVSAIADILTAEEGDAVAASGTVMAVTTKGFLLQDATGILYVYTNGDVEVAVGNNVTASGKFDNYFGTLQIGGPATVTANDKATAVPTYPDPTDLTDQAAYDAFKTYSETNPVDYPYVKVKGVLSDGRYITVGTSDKQSMIYYSASDYSGNNGKTVTVTGYIVGFHSTNGYYQLVETNVEVDQNSGNDDGGDTPGDDVTPPAGGDDPAPSEGSWAKVTSLTDLTAGKYVVVFKHDDDGKYYAMTNASASKNPSGIEVTVEGAAISGNVDASVQWTFTGDNEAGFSISAGDNYLNSKDDSQGISISTTSTCKWYVTEDASNGYLLQRKDTEIARYLAAYRNSSGVVTFRYYNVGASYKGELMFFKQAE